MNSTTQQLMQQPNAFQFTCKVWFLNAAVSFDIRPVSLLNACTLDWLVILLQHITYNSRQTGSKPCQSHVQKHEADVQAYAVLASRACGPQWWRHAHMSRRLLREVVDKYNQTAVYSPVLPSHGP